MQFSQPPQRLLGVSGGFQSPNQSHGRIAWWLVGVWVLTMIAIPIVRWTVGDGALHWGVTLSVYLLTLTVLIALWQQWGWRATVRLVALVGPLAWGLEWLGSTTGFPFGVYHYTAVLQPQVAGVPLLIPVAWLMMLPPAWAVASVIGGGRRDWRFVLVSAAVFTAWDLFLDPQMVGWGYWVWATPGGYFGIPWVNFGGWFLGAALLTVIVRPPQLAAPLFVTIYAITWFLQTVGQAIFWQMPGPALAGGLGMGIFLLLAYLRAQRAISLQHSPQPLL
jgi:lycopene beta-cyclase